MNPRNETMDQISSRVVERNINSLERGYTKDGVTIEFDFYFRGESHHHPAWDFVLVELSVRNETPKPIEITPGDLFLKLREQSIRAKVVGYRTVQEHLFCRGVTSYQWLDISGSPALPHEVVLFLPLLIGLGISIDLPKLALAIRDYASWKQKTTLLRRDSFAYGRIGSSQTRHGFVYFKIDIDNQDTLLYRLLSHWKVGVTIHPSSGKATYHYELQGESKSSAYLPGLGCIIPGLVCQVAIFIIVGHLAAKLLSISASLGSLVCSGVYLILALPVLYVLSRDSLY